MHPDTINRAITLGFILVAAAALGMSAFGA